MRVRFNSLVRFQFAIIAMITAVPAMVSAEGPTVEQALGLAPIQKDVNFDTPEGDQVEQCTIKSEDEAGGTALVVRGPSGELLRRFADTNKDNKIDQWCYFRLGSESYRDIDGDFNGKADQYRWFGVAGMRWADDKNEDGRIDSWRAISAEEVTAEAIEAVRQRDVARFQRLLISPDELRSLGLGPQIQGKLTTSLQAATKDFAELVARQDKVPQDASWMHFGASPPGMLPAGTDGSKSDVLAYENAVAMFETEGKTGQLQIGTMLRVRDCWRMVSVPTGLLAEEDALAVSGFMFSPMVGQQPPETALPPNAVDGEAQKLVGQLQELEKTIATASDEKQRAAILQQQAQVLTQLINATKSDEERAVWIRQLVDTLRSAAQTGESPQAERSLEQLAQQLAADEKSSDVAAYAEFQLLNLAFARGIEELPEDENNNEAYQKLHEVHQASLEEFVDKHPDSPDAVEAMLQLAIAEEFAGNEKEALGWYDRIIKAGGDSLNVRKAIGAKTRLTSVGKPVQLQGKSIIDGKPVSLAGLTGRVVLLHYWATWSEPCKQDIEMLQRLIAKYGPMGFTAIGVNLDNDRDELVKFLRANRMSWPQLYEDGGLDSRLAVEMGILTVPTMILVDDKGNVLDLGVHMASLETELGKRLKR